MGFGACQIPRLHLLNPICIDEAILASDFIEMSMSAPPFDGIETTCQHTSFNIGLPHAKRRKVKLYEHGQHQGTRSHVGYANLRQEER